jgi:hypothetical protein
MTSNITNLGALTPSQECGKSFRIPLELTRDGRQLCSNLGSLKGFAYGNINTVATGP